MLSSSKVVIVVLLWRKLTGIETVRRLISIGGYDKLVVSFDGGYDPIIFDKVSSLIKSTCTGEIRVSKINLGIKEHMIRCADYIRDDEHIVFIEDDIAVSDSYMDYVRNALPLLSSDDSLIQLSLYSYRCNEWTKQMFLPYTNKNSFYAMMVPSSWGHVFLGKRYKEFCSWMNRSKTLFKESRHLLPPEVRLWSDQSWKKYLFLYMFLQKKYTLYPKLSISTIVPSDEGVHTKACATELMVPIIYYREINYTLDSSLIRYDMYFEIQPSSLGFSEEIIIDTYGYKLLEGFEKSKYILTSRHINKPLESAFIDVLPIPKVIRQMTLSTEINTVSINRDLNFGKVRDVKGGIAYKRRFLNFHGSLKVLSRSFLFVVLRLFR